MPSTEIEKLIQDTLTVRRSFIRGSWTVSIDIVALNAELILINPGFRVLRMPNGWIYVGYIIDGVFDDDRHTIGGGGGQTSYASQQSILKPPKIETIPNSVFPNVFVSNIYSLAQIKPSKLAEYIEMENNFKRIANKMRGGRKNKKSKNKKSKNKKTKKRSKKQTRKRVLTKIPSP
jgi:hypothetical protein